MQFIIIVRCCCNCKVSTKSRTSASGKPSSALVHKSTGVDENRSKKLTKKESTSNKVSSSKNDIAAMCVDSLEYEDSSTLVPSSNDNSSVAVVPDATPSILSHAADSGMAGEKVVANNADTAAELQSSVSGCSENDSKTVAQDKANIDKVSFSSLHLKYRYCFM